MNIFFLNKNESNLANEDCSILDSVKSILISHGNVSEVFSPTMSDAIIIQEKNSFKNFRYIKELLSDPIISAYPEKVYTINSDDCATGLLRGLYTSLPKSRFDPNIHVSVPYIEFPNELVFKKRDKVTVPKYLASWRGNPKSNVIRKNIISQFSSKKDYCIQDTTSWLNHSNEEKEIYIELMLNSKFSLCPAGWAPVSFRIYESMALGICPIILSDNFVPPVGPDWESFALFFPQKNLEKLDEFLNRLADNYLELGDKAYYAWDNFFSKDNIYHYYAESLKELIFSSHKSSRIEEVSRWSSFSMFWKNHWTIPQRLINKISILYDRSI